MTPYADQAEANAYFFQRLRTDSWDNASSTNRIKALSQATMAIDRLNFAGDKSDEEQENQFPRGGDTEIPEDIKNACCELALSLLDGVDADLEIENLVIATQGVAETKITYDRSFALDHIRAGIPSLAAWRLLQPYLRDPLEVNISRVS